MVRIHLPIAVQGENKRAQPVRLYQQCGVARREGIAKAGGGEVEDLGVLRSNRELVSVVESPPDIEDDSAYIRAREDDLIRCVGAPGAGRIAAPRYTSSRVELVGVGSAGELEGSQNGLRRKMILSASTRSIQSDAEIELAPAAPGGCITEAIGPIEL
jgi:hypothetical protein